MAFYELRQYKVRPGKMDAWVKIMEEEIIPFQVSKGMVITGSFRGETDETHYVWIRRFDNEAQREALYKAVYDTDHWRRRSRRGFRNTWIVRGTSSRGSFLLPNPRYSSCSLGEGLRGIVPRHLPWKRAPKRGSLHRR